MCRYVKYTNTSSQLMYVAQEHSIYGSSRVGVDNRKDTLYMSAAYTPTWGGVGTSRRDLGSKSFELANHLGNVLVTVSDKPVYKVSSTTIFFNPEITSISDYYPFGAPIQGRSAAFGGEYRFGFNNHEKDDEVSWEGNQIELRYRSYDVRLGRFFAIDPVAHRYPYWTLYQFAGNLPIKFIDQEGLQPGESAFRAGLVLASPEAYHLELNAHQVQLENMKNVNPMECLHFILDGLGFIPGIGEFADAGNAAIYTAEGDYLNAAFSTISLTFVAGDLAAKGFKYSLKAAGYESKSFKSLNAAQKWLGNAMEYGFKSADAIANKSGLRTALQKAGMKMGAKTDQAHHLIPVNLIGKNANIRKAIDEGFDFNGKINGLFISETRHSGPHGKYDAYVNNLINSAFSNNDNIGKSAKMILEGVAESLKETLQHITVKVNETF